MSCFVEIFESNKRKIFKMNKRQLLISLSILGFSLVFSFGIFAQQKISLAGTWELKLDPQDKGLREDCGEVYYA